MGTTRIEWADKVWNPITGCTKISPGCHNCYAERMATRLAGRCGYREDAPFSITMHGDRLHQPYDWKKPARIFVGSMGDIFHDDVEWNWLFSIFQMAGQLQRHRFLFLTKRPERMQDELTGDLALHLQRQPWCTQWPLPNVWLGVTAENQEMANTRIPLLLHIPAAVRFVSVEPLLSHIDLSPFLDKSIQKGEYGNEQRRSLVRTGDIGRVEDKQQWGDLDCEGKESRTQDSARISSGSQDAERDKDSCGCSPACLSSFQRKNTSGMDDKSHKWEKERQQPLQPGSRELFRESESCVQDRPKNSERAQKSERQVIGFGNYGNSGKICQRGNNSKTISNGIRGSISDNIENHQKGISQINLVICGGESGPHARPMHPDWARGLRDQCVAAQVPFFFKQWGEWAPRQDDDEALDYPACEVNNGPGSRRGYLWPDGEWSFRVGKKAAGRILDGQEWLQVPEAKGDEQ